MIRNKYECLEEVFYIDFFLLEYFLEVLIESLGYVFGGEIVWLLMNMNSIFL